MDVECRWIHAQMNADERESVVSSFQAGRDLEAKQLPIRIIVGTTRIIGQGLNLNRACRIVLMEPQRSSAIENQASTRIHRIGSLTDKCWVYRLHNPASELERTLMQDHKSEQFRESVALWFTDVPGDHSDSAEPEQGWFRTLEDRELRDDDDDGAAGFEM